MEGDLYTDELPAASAIAGTDLVPIFQTETKQATFAQVLTYIMGTAMPKIPRVESIVTDAAPGADVSSYRIDQFNVTALDTNATFAAPSGTPVDGQKLRYRIKDDGTPRTLAFHGVHRFSSDLPAPSTTTASKTLYMDFIYNSVDAVWDCVKILDNF